MPTGTPVFVGVDLGTTNSVVATIDPHGRPVCVPNSVGDTLTPSILFFEPGDGPAIVGKEALRAAQVETGVLVDAVKREMGKSFYPREIRGKLYPPAALSGVLLHRLLEDARQRLGAFDQAVITVPAYFNEPRRKATMDAALMAGLREVELLNEPTAAALAFGYEMGVFSETGEITATATKVPGRYTLLVYDLGGGTFDVTIMTIQDRHFRALVCDGDVQLGGRDWDDRLVRFAVQTFEENFGSGIGQSPEALLAVRIEAEEAKRSLSQRAKTLLRLIHDGNKLTIELTRDDLKNLTQDLLERTRLTCELAMQDAKLGWDQVDSVLLVGGSSRMPMVHDMLLELTGFEPSRAVSPDEAVAQGAALYARMLWGEQAGKLQENVQKNWRPAKITDVNSHSLGIVGVDRKTKERKVSVLISKNTAIPHSNSKIFRTQYENQDRIHMQIVEGESSDPDDCAVIGECRIAGLPKKLPASHPVTVTFAYRRDGRIFVEAQVEGAQPFQVEIDRKQKLTPEDLENWASELIEIGDDEEALAKARPKAPVHEITLETKQRKGPKIRKTRKPSHEEKDEGTEKKDEE